MRSPYQIHDSRTSLSKVIGLSTTHPASPGIFETGIFDGVTVHECFKICIKRNDVVRPLNKTYIKIPKGKN